MFRFADIFFGPDKPHVFNLWDERIPGKGEDAAPLCLERDGIFLMAVFDGLGGAGARAYEVGERWRRQISGARLAARMARAATQRWFRDIDLPFTAPAAVVALRLAIEKSLGQLRARARPIGSGRLSGRLIGDFPTTVAALIIDRNEGVQHAIWAGDSRCYLLTPKFGLQQVSRDDARDGGDAFEQLRRDPPMTNYATPDGFHLHVWTRELMEPSLAIVATDGCFQFWPTPMHFEHAVLGALVSASSAAEWGMSFSARLANITGDDSTLVMLGLGWRSLGDITRAFGRRTEDMRRCVRDLDLQRERADGAVAADNEFLEAAKIAWAEYRRHYEASMAAVVRPETVCK